MLEVKARIGVAETFVFWPDSQVTGSVAFSFRHPTLGAIAPAATQAFTTATITAIGTDLRTLTCNALAPAPDAMAGEDGGHAMLIGTNRGDFPVRVTEASSGTIVLADPLPRGVAVLGTTTLQWSTWSATLPSATITSVAARVPWTATWTARHGGGSDYPDSARVAEGILYVVRSPFSTGCTDADIYAYAPSLGAQVPRSQNGWAPQRRMAERMLVRWLRRDLREHDVTEDAVNGGALTEVHAFLAASVILSGQHAAGADRERQASIALQAAKDLYADVMRSIPWLDIDGDGVIDSGEADVQNGPRASWVGGLFGGADSDFVSTDFPTFRRNQSH